MPRAALALLVSLAVSPPAFAAQPPRVSLPVGVRVRVAAPPRIGWITGTVGHSDSARIILRATGGAPPDTIPLAGVQAHDVSRGRERMRRACAVLSSAALWAGQRERWSREWS